MDEKLAAYFGGGYDGRQKFCVYTGAFLQLGLAMYVQMEARNILY